MVSQLHYESPEVICSSISARLVAIVVVKASLQVLSDLEQISDKYQGSFRTDRIVRQMLALMVAGEPFSLFAFLTVRTNLCLLLLLHLLASSNGASAQMTNAFTS